MRHLLAALAVTLLSVGPAVAFAPDTADVLTRVKAGKPVKIEDVATMMRDSERWCYKQADGHCAWSDIYLQVTADGALYEISHAWSATEDISLIDKGEFRDNRFICETGFDWVPSVYVTRRSDGVAVGGRALQAIKDGLDPSRGRSSLLCFDYIYLRSDEAAQTVTLRQRSHDGDTMLPDDDAEVTLHFDPASAAALTQAW